MGSEVGAAVVCGLCIWWRWVGLWPVCVRLCLSSLSERFSRKCVDEMRGLCSLITSEATTAERNTHKHTEQNEQQRPLQPLQAVRQPM